ncbi:MAG: hypothetical protein ACTSP4_00650 [Candidatus Hodarchaeales archaeon]
MGNKIEQIDIGIETKGQLPDARPIVEMGNTFERFSKSFKREEVTDSSLGFYHENLRQLRKDLKTGFDTKGVKYKNNDISVVSDILSTKNAVLTGFEDYEYKEGELNTFPGTDIEITKGSYDLLIDLDRQRGLEEQRNTTAEIYNDIKDIDNIFSEYGPWYNVPSNLIGSVSGTISAGIFGTGVTETAKNFADGDYVYAQRASAGDVFEAVGEIAGLVTGGTAKIVSGGLLKTFVRAVPEAIVTSSSISHQSKDIVSGAETVGKSLGIEGLGEEAKERTKLNAKMVGLLTAGIPLGVYGARLGIGTIKKSVLKGAENVQTGANAYLAMSPTNIYSKSNMAIIEDSIEVSNARKFQTTNDNPVSLKSTTKANQTLEIKNIASEGIIYEKSIDVSNIETKGKWNDKIDYNRDLANGVVIYKDIDGNLSILDGDKRIAGAKSADGKINGYVLSEELGFTKKSARAFSDIDIAVKTGNIKKITKYGFADDVAERMVKSMRDMDKSFSVFMRMDDNSKRFMMENKDLYNYDKFNEITKLKGDDQLKALQMYRDGDENLDGLKTSVLKDDMMGYKYYQEGINEIATSYRRMPKDMKKSILAIEDQLVGARRNNPGLVVSDKDIIDHYLHSNYQNNKEFRDAIGKGISEGRRFVESYRRGDLRSITDADINSPKPLRNSDAKRGDQAYDSTVKYSNVSEVEATTSRNFKELNVNDNSIVYGNRNIDLDSEYKFTDVDGVEQSMTYREALEDANSDELIKQASTACSVGG